MRALEGRPSHDNVGSLSVSRSARYPRVAVILGVPSKWHIPLLLCRSLSTVSALWWACQALISIANIIRYPDQSARSSGSDGSHPSTHEVALHRMSRRLAIAQIALSFLWVRTFSTTLGRSQVSNLSRLFCDMLPLNWQGIENIMYRNADRIHLRPVPLLTSPIYLLHHSCHAGSSNTPLSLSWSVSAASRFCCPLDACRSFVSQPLQNQTFSN